MAIVLIYNSEIIMTQEQKDMLDNAPERDVVKKSMITPKRVAIVAGVVALGVGAYVVLPKVVSKVQLYRSIKSAATVI